MNTNIEILENNGHLGDVRKRMGADSSDDETYDNDINLLTAKELVEKVSGWELGSEEWGGKYVELYVSLVEEGAKREDNHDQPEEL